MKYFIYLIMCVCLFWNEIQFRSSMMQLGEPSHSGWEELDESRWNVVLRSLASFSSIHYDTVVFAAPSSAAQLSLFQETDFSVSFIITM